MTDTLPQRIEAAERADRALDRAIFVAMFPERVPSPIVTRGYGWREDNAGWWLATGEDSRTPPKALYPPRYTASIDAALTLVPEGWSGIVYLNGAASVWQDVGKRNQVNSHAATPALALCAAALRAKDRADD